MPITLIDTILKVAEPELLTNLNDEELGEEIVARFIAHANAERRAAGLPDLGVGSLCDTPSTESLKASAKILRNMSRAIPHAA